MSAKPYIILVGMDFSELADQALRQAFELAARREASEVHVLCVVPGPSLEAHHGLTGYFLTSEAGVRDGVFESLRAHVQAALDTFVARSPSPPSSSLAARPPSQVASHVRIATPAIALVEAAAELGADLIVLGAHGHHGRARRLLGSVAESAMRYAGCPVLVVPLETAPEVRASEPPWSSISVPPLSATHQPSVRPRAL